MKICLVCSHGGHLTEMLQLMDAFEGHDVFFITYDSGRTRQLHSRHLIPYIGTNPLKMTVAAISILRVLRRQKPDLIVSTGPEIAIPALYIARLLGIRTLFIETWARLAQGSGAGRLVYPVADVFLVQWEKLLSRYGGKARYEGAIVSHVQHHPEARERDNLVFVTVGVQHPKGFERLVRRMDEIAGRIKEDVIMQIGRTRYTPKNAEYFRFATEERMRELLRRARVVVMHGGVGTLLDAWQEGAPVIAVPRLSKHREAIDNHQLYLVKELEKQGALTVVHDVHDLERVLLNLDREPGRLVSDRRLVNALKRYVAQFERG